MRYSELRQKEVINVLDGRRLGYIVDMDLQLPEGRALSVVVPGPVRVFRLMRGDRGGMVIPWQRICKIGDDVILVELDEAFFTAYQTPPGAGPVR